MLLILKKKMNLPHEVCYLCFKVVLFKYKFVLSRFIFSFRYNMSIKWNIIQRECKIFHLKLERLYPYFKQIFFICKGTHWYQDTNAFTYYRNWGNFGIYMWNGRLWMFKKNYMFLILFTIFRFHPILTEFVNLLK